MTLACPPGGLASELEDLGLSAQDYGILSVFRTRPELSASELARISQVTRQTMHTSVLSLEDVDEFFVELTTPTIFIIGSDDPYLSIERARPSIDQIQGARLYEVPRGHAPWLVDAEHAAELIAAHSLTTGPHLTPPGMRP